MTEFRTSGGCPARQEGGAPPASPSIELTLPIPPSVNAMFRNVRGVGRVKSKAYLDWLGHAGWVLRSQRPGAIKGRVLVVVSAEQAGAASDIDNRIKALFDLLVSQGVIEDDRFVVGFCAAWAPPANRMARVMIIPAASLDFTFHLAGDGAHGGWFLKTPNEDFNDFPVQPEADVG